MSFAERHKHAALLVELHGTDAPAVLTIIDRSGRIVSRGHATDAERGWLLAVVTAIATREDAWASAEAGHL